jgi:hypothetical protein
MYFTIERASGGFRARIYGDNGGAADAEVLDRTI